MGKPQSGVALGNLAWFGSYSECKNLTQANYCLASIKINLRQGNKTQVFPIQWGLFVPETCDDDDITNGLEKILSLVDKILSARFWIPLSHLTYTAYFVHPIVLFVFFGSFQTVLAYSDLHLAFYFVGTLSLSYSVAFIVSVCVEYTTLQLEKLLFNRDR